MAAPIPVLFQFPNTWHKRTFKLYLSRMMPFVVLINNLLLTDEVNHLFMFSDYMDSCVNMCLLKYSIFVLGFLCAT